MSDIFTPPTPTEDELATISLNYIVSENITGLTDFQVHLSNGWNMVWNNSYGLTPQKMFDKMGTGSVGFFQAASITQAYLAQIVPNYSPLVPPQTFNINADGSVASPSPVPQGLTVTGIAGATVLNWTAITGAQSYNVKQVSGTTSNVSTNTFTDNSTVAGNTYTYTVSAMYPPASSSGESGDSTPVSITV